MIDDNDDHDDHDHDDTQELFCILQAGQIVIIDPTDVAVERKESFVGR